MSSSLPTVPAGENPFLFYCATLEASKPAPSDPTGLKIRLIVLLTLLAYALVFSLVNLGVHLWASKLRNRSLFLFRLVRRQGGTGLIGVCCVPVLATNVYFVWSAFLGDGSGIEKMLVLQFSALPIAYFFGWLLTWATFQSFLQVEGGRHRSRFAVPAWLETLAYIGGLVVTVGVLVGLTVPAALANNKQWETFDKSVAYLTSAAPSWNGTALSPQTLAVVAQGLSDVKSTTEDFFAAARHLAIAGSILPAIMLFINGGMWFFVHTIRKQVSFQLSKLATVQVSTIRSEAAPASPPTSDVGMTPKLQTAMQSTPEKKKDDLRRPHPFPSPSIDHLPTFIPLKVLTKSDHSKKHSHALGVSSPTRLPPAIHFVDTVKKNRDRQDSSAPRPLTRGKIRALSEHPDRLARDHAERLMLMMRAEQELLTLSSSVFFIAAGLTIWCGWSIGKLKSHATNTWADNEGLYLAPIWVYAVGLAFAETLHAWIEWRHLAPWRAGRARARSFSTGSTHSHSGSRSNITPGVAVLPLDNNGAATAVQVQVHVVTQHEVGELDDYELAFGGKGGRERVVVEPIGVALGGGDAEGEGSFEEEKGGEGWEMPRKAARRPVADEVWRG
ncbi:hypothetical protein JCM6882_002567 [Rhodosporidiobolus microsporus]